MFSPLPFFHNIGYIIQSLIGRDNDHLIPDAHHVLTVRHDQHTVTVNRCDQQIFFQRQFLKRNVKDRRRLPDHKFQCFHTVVYQAVKCLYITADGIFHGTYITHDVFCRHSFAVVLSRLTPVTASYAGLFSSAALSAFFASRTFLTAALT